LEHFAIWEGKSFIIIIIIKIFIIFIVIVSRSSSVFLNSTFWCRVFTSTSGTFSSTFLVSSSVFSSSFFVVFLPAPDARFGLSPARPDKEGAPLEGPPKVVPAAADGGGLAVQLNWPPDAGVDCDERLKLKFQLKGCCLLSSGFLSVVIF